MPQFSSAKSLLLFILFYRWPIRLGILSLSLVAALLGLAGPFFQKEFVDALLGYDSRLGLQLTPLPAIFFAFLSFISAQGLGQLCNYISQKESIIAQSLLGRFIYRKTLELKPDAIYDHPTGEVVALYATDVPGATILLDQTLPAGASTLFPFILAPFALAYFLDFSVWVTLSVMLTITMLNTAMAFRQSRYFFLFKQLAAERVGLVNEWIQNIRAIRILGWTDIMEESIFKKRITETRNRILMVTNGQAMNAISSSITFFLNIVALSSLIYFSDRTPTPGDLLALLWILGVFLIRPFRQMPWFFTFGFDAWTSIKRIQLFLATKNTKAKVGAATLKDGPDIALSVNGLSLKIGKKQILNNLSFKVQDGELFGIVGEVGSGKSMLMLSLLGETGAQFRDFQLYGVGVETITAKKWKSFFGIVPQEGFIMSASLRDNVMFDYNVSKDCDLKITKSLQAASFDLHKERIEAGLDTVIGERGVNLSGGQKQRISLARSHYLSASVLLLDDCFSAIDVDTEERLMDDLIFGEWKNKTKILVTHRLRILPRCNHILFIKDGQCVATGTYPELFENCAEFREFIESTEFEKGISDDPVLA